MIGGGGGESGEVIATRASMRVGGEQKKYVRHEQFSCTMKGGYIIYYINMKLS